MAKNAAALAAGATEAQGLNAAGAAAGHIFLEVWRFAERQGARPESMIGLAGTGDLVGHRARAAEPQPARGRAARRGRARGRDPGADRPGGRGARHGAAAGRARSTAADVEAPVTHALNRLIAGELPLEDWVAQVRATVPPPARFDSGAAWRRWWWRLRTRMRGRPA